VSVIARDLHLEGTLSSGGSIHVEGTVVGTIQAGRLVHVAEGGIVEGDIEAHEAILSGEVNGSIIADGRVEVHAAAVIHGDITTPRLVVNEGGVVCGDVHMAMPKRADEPASEPVAKAS
jgi:cytoskeletal protein CcmA (bactofilin family)